MKKFLLISILLPTMGYFSNLHAQCTLGSPGLTITNVNPATCEVTFDLTFTGNFNNGNKHAVLHLWEDPNGGYPASITYPATKEATSAAKGTLVIKDPGTSTPTYEPSYPSSLGTLTSPYLNPTSFLWNGANTSRTFTLKGLKVTLSSCASAKRLIADVYATQNDQNTSGGCVTRGAFNFVANEPAMRASLFCSSPTRTFTLSFSTLTQTSITFSAYRDVAPLGIFDAADLQAANQLILTDGDGSSLTKTINNPAQPANQYTTYGPYGYSTQPNGSKFDVWIVANAGANTYSNILLIQNSCALLPVTFKSFAASRNNQTVALKWETASEQNNRGFYVQRNINGEWKDVAFVFSRAEGGNSSDILSYEYKDANALKTVSYYRILQVDLDGKGRYSETRIVKGLEEANDKLLLFPNPGTKGKINLLFNGETSAKDVIVYDAHGRVVKTFKNVVSNNLIIDQLKPGVYNVQVKNTAAQTVLSDKFIIQN